MRSPQTKQPNNEIWYTTNDGEIVVPQNGAFNGLTILSNSYLDGKGVITFDGPVCEVGAFAFSECDNLEGIHLSESVVTIEADAFRECHNLTHITLPQVLKTIGSGVFNGCKSLCEIVVPDSVEEIYRCAFGRCRNLKSVTLPKGLTTIREALFWDCRSLESIFIPSSVRIIEEFAFEDCTGLRRVDIDDLVSWCSMELFRYNSNPLHLGADLYLGGVRVTHITIPEEVTTINCFAFCGFAALERLTLHGGITAIGSDAFMDCNNLKRIDIADLESWCRLEFSQADYDPLMTDADLYLNGEIITDIDIVEGEWLFHYAVGSVGRWPSR